MTAAGSRPRTLAIIGTGLMGGSLGLAARRAGTSNRIFGYDVDEATLQRAVERGAVTHAAGSPADAVAEAEFVFIATPIEAIPKVFSQIAASLRQGAIVSDLGSTKAKVVEEIIPTVPEHAHFVGGHPIAGAEQEGIEAAEADLYRGCIWIVTPTETTDASAYRELVRFLSQLEARVLSLDPRRHDELVALTSHLPQLLSSSLMGFAAEITAEEGGLPLVGAGGFRDMTRIAASSPDMWMEIVRTNRDAVMSVLTRFESAVTRVRESISSQDWEGLRKILTEAKEAREGLPAKPGLAASDLVELLIPVIDRPGILAEITTTVGEAGVNIEDIDIVHSPEGGRGRIHLAVNGEEAARRASEAIVRKGYRVTRAGGAEEQR